MSDGISFRALDPEGVPDGDYVLTVSGGHVTGLTAAGGGGSTTATREPLMATGVSPPEPLESSDGGDWLYGEVSS